MIRAHLKEIANEQLHSRLSDQSIEELTACARICTLFHDATVTCTLSEECFGNPNVWQAKAVELFDALCEAEKRSSDPIERGRAIHTLYTLYSEVLSLGNGDYRARCDCAAEHFFRTFSPRPDLSETLRITLHVCRADYFYPDFDSAFERSFQEPLFRWTEEVDANDAWPGITTGQVAERLRLYALNANLLLDNRFDALYLKVRDRMLREVHAEDISGTIAAYELSTVYNLPEQPSDTDTTAHMAARLYELGSRLPNGAERMRCIACIVHWLTDRLCKSIQTGIFAKTA